MYVCIDGCDNSFRYHAVAWWKGFILLLLRVYLVLDENTFSFPHPQCPEWTPFSEVTSGKARGTAAASTCDSSHKQTVKLIKWKQRRCSSKLLMYKGPFVLLVFNFLTFFMSAQGNSVQTSHLYSLTCHTCYVYAFWRCGIEFTRWLWCIISRQSHLTVKPRIESLSDGDGKHSVSFILKRSMFPSCLTVSPATSLALIAFTCTPNTCYCLSAYPQKTRFLIVSPADTDRLSAELPSLRQPLVLRVISYLLGKLWTKLCL